MHVGRVVVALGIAGALLAGGGAAAGGHPRIGPDQHFAGVVNGARDHPTVFTVCPGPSTTGKGHVAGGQTWSVASLAAGHGFTGPFSQVYAWFVPAKARSTVVAVKFARYGVAKAIPTQIRVPCDGDGTVEFSSCPYLAPCAAGWVPDDVAVHFVNIAA